MATSQLRFTYDEILQDHEFATPHMVGDTRLHGGFLADGSYQPPRALVREQAFDAWEAQLRSRGGQLLDASADLLRGHRMPSVPQQCLLIRNGLSQTFWNDLTIIGKIEARGRLLADIEFPDLQPAIVEDISEMAVGHLNAGLLVAHGLDEGGEPERGVGGHDAMWFAARDLAFGSGAFPDIDPPERIARPDGGTRLVPEIAPEIESLVSFIANLLIIEFRAEVGFADTQAVLRTPGLFPNGDPELAAELVERIRTDELIHVRSLRLYLGELVALTFRTDDGGTIDGATVISRFWAELVRWATVEQPQLAAANKRDVLIDQIRSHVDAERLIAAFEELEFTSA